MLKIFIKLLDIYRICAINDYMAQNKKAEFKKDSQSLSDFAKVLSHPARLEILLEIAKKESCICGEIVEVLPLAQSTVSQHLKELKSAGLISGEVEGTKSCYCVNFEELSRNLKRWERFFEKLNEYNKKGDCC